MNRRRYLAACGTGLAALAGCNAPVVDDGTTDPSAQIVNPGFESGLRGWLIGRDLPTDPNTGLPVESAARVVDDPVASGDAALQLFINGLQDDGVIWAQQAARFDEVDTLSVSVHSPEESFNTITRLAVYAGPRPERGWLREADFDTERAIEDRAGWNRYEYEVDAEDVGIVAVGVSVVWETEVARAIDDVTLS
ncbi:hypothetical protein [Halogeometricum luteum]|uniref:Uncharacterized protein n=1 Tax=Halogeometricum luteum TaxID=2950537 RepID=A0ABU2G882_9EURY|nr:hypothetical protein [Halogeometricum sp. S3BR5-2]MDS0296348.1 hypothetical protein [Halogeometricum sp. S3BR5-2]